MKPEITKDSQNSKSYFITLILITLICVTFMACSNPAEPEGSLDKSTDISDTDKIIGRWQWVQSIGGIAGIRVTPESSGRSEMLVFDGTNLKQYVNNELAVENNYRLGMGVTIFSTDSIPVIFLDDIISFGYYFEGNDRLVLYENFYDGFARHFVKE